MGEQEPQQPEAWPVRAGRLATRYATPIISVAGLAAITCSVLWVEGEPSSPPRWGALIVSLGLAAWGQFRSWKEVPVAESLARDNQRLKRELDDSWSHVRDACDSQLATLANDILKLNDTDRISLYKHKGDVFVIAGRYSKNPEYRKPGRPFYPDTEGCIMTAWQSGEAFVDDLPDPSSDLDGYLDVLNDDWKLPKEVGRGLRMKSRTLFARALEEPGGMKNRTAVLVIESVEVAAFDVSDLRNTMGAKEAQHIQQYLERRQTQEADPEFALKEGF